MRDEDTPRIVLEVTEFELLHIPVRGLITHILGVVTMQVVGSILSTKMEAAIAQAEVTYSAAAVEHQKAVNAAESASNKASLAVKSAKDHLKSIVELKNISAALADLGTASEGLAANKTSAASELKSALKAASADNTDEQEVVPDHLGNITSQMEETKKLLESAGKAIEDVNAAVEGFAAEKEAAEKAVLDAEGAYSIALAQSKFDIAAAMAELAKASDAKQDAIDQAKTDFNKAADRPNVATAD